MVDGELINSDSPINADWIERRKAKGKWNEDPTAANKKPPLEIPAKDLASLPGNFDDAPDASTNDEFKFDADDEKKSGSPYQLDLQIKKLKIARESELVEIDRMKKEKMQGETIPTTVVESLITQHFKNMTRSILDGVSSYSAIMAKQFGASKKEKTDLDLTFESITNEAIHKAAELTRGDLQSIVDEYKATRTRGERK